MGRNVFAAFVLGCLLAAGVSAIAGTLEGADSAGGIVRADVFKAGGTSDTGALRVATKSIELWDSGVVAAGAVIASPVVNTAGCSTVTVTGLNSGAVARALSWTAYRGDGTTVIQSGSANVNAGVAGDLNIAPVVGAGLNGAGHARTIPNRMSFQLAAGGAGNGRVTAICR